MSLRGLFKRKPTKDLDTNEILRRAFRRKVVMFTIFLTTYLVFTFFSSSYTLSYAIPLGILVSPVLFYLNLYIFRKYIEIENLEISLREETEAHPIAQEDKIVRRARPMNGSPESVEAPFGEESG